MAGRSFSLRSASGLKATITQYGARVAELFVPVAGGERNVTLGFDRLEPYLSDRMHLGAIAGRYANRIGGARFTLDGREYRLPLNDGRNTLHGGPGGSPIWQAEPDGETLRLTLHSPDGDQGFPGALDVVVEYRLDGDALIIDYAATSDALTVLNLGRRTMTKSIRRRGTRGAAAGLFGFLAWSSPAAPADVNVLERSYNAFRTGVNAAESALTPANVRSEANQFHRRFVMKVDGKIEGSPLYVSGINIAGGTHNVVYVATMHNTVFAFDADNGAQLSARWLGAPVTGDDLHALKPTTIHSEWGIAGTPIIDLATGTLYVVRWGYENGVSGPTFRLFGLDISNLNNDKFPSVLIDGYNVGGTGFNRFRQMQRAGLALTTKPGGAKAVVVAFAGGEGQGSASGCVVVFDTSKLASGGAPANVWCSDPNNGAGVGGGTGVWMANAAPAVDDNGDIYVVTGNGPYHPQFGL